MGIKHMLGELGIQADITIEIDASAAQGMMQRRGIGRLRHLEVQQLWTQDALSKGVFRLRKIPNEVNTADLGTKPLGREDVEKNLKLMSYRLDLSSSNGLQSYNKPLMKIEANRNLLIS